MRERGSAADGRLNGRFTDGETEVEFGDSPATRVLDEHREIVRFRETMFVGRAAAQRAEGESRYLLFPDRLPGRLTAIALAGVPIQDHAVDQIALPRGRDGRLGILGSQKNDSLPDQSP